jgi:PqqD family protein of HPr-rel-A system
MADRDQGRWLAVQPARLRVRRWDDEVVVYDDRSGDTHLLDDACGRVLERLLTASGSDQELAALCAGSEDSPGSPEARLYRVLDRLRRLGLVKPLRK